MTFSKGESHLLLALAVMGGVMGCEELQGLFHRRGEFERARDGLVRLGLVTFDGTRNEVGVLRERVAIAMGLNAPRTPPLDWQERPLDAPLQEVCGGGPAARENSARVRAENAQSSAENAHGGGKGENVERLIVPTFQRLNVERCEGLKARVRKFVGEDDFFRHWDRAGYLWREPERMELLERSLNYLVAGVRSGEVWVRTSNGRALWSQVQCDWREFQQGKAL